MKAIRSADYSSVSDLVKVLQGFFDLAGPETDLSELQDWPSGVPDGAVPYLNAFRMKYFEYDRHIELLDEFFQVHGVHTVGDLGCGVATHLIELAKRGYHCVGIDQSEDSLSIAEQKAKSAGVDIDLVRGNIRSVELDFDLDAVISMYVPLSPAGSTEALLNANRLLRDGGLFAKVHGTPDPSGVPSEDSIYDVDVAETDEFRAARLEHWWISGEVLSWTCYYFVRDTVPGTTYPNNVRVFTDHNDIRFRRHYDPMEQEQEWLSSGYELVDLCPIPDSRAAPPWTQENLVFLRKLS